MVGQKEERPKNSIVANRRLTREAYGDGYVFGPPGCGRVECRQVFKIN